MTRRGDAAIDNVTREVAAGQAPSFSLIALLLIAPLRNTLKLQRRLKTGCSLIAISSKA